MNTRSVLWLGAVVCLAAGWIHPPQADASNFLIRLHHVSPDESEPEIPNETMRIPDEVSIDSGRRVADPAAWTPMARPENWFYRVLRIMRLINLGGLAR
jgi:hypothetical protein